MRLTELWNSQPPEIQAALIAAVVSLLTALLTIFGTVALKPVQDRLGLFHLKRQLKTEHEYEQRKLLAETINRYRGLILRDADLMKTRIFNLYRNERRRWLRVDAKKEGLESDETDYQAAGYYFKTTIYRFLAVTTSIQQFEDKALYIDPKIAESEDYDFVYGLRLLQKAATDASLFTRPFKHPDYDSTVSKDHFFSDTLRVIAESCWKGERFMTREEFRSQLGKNDDFDPVLQFFDDLKAGEDRLRWDRLVVFHLFLIAFINTYGYGFQRTKPSELADVVKRIEHDVVRKNLAVWLREYRLLDQSVYGKNLQAISDELTK
jgi:hypothetical protein